MKFVKYNDNKSVTIPPAVLTVCGLKGNVVQEPGMELVIPRGMLYEDVALNCHVVK